MVVFVLMCMWRENAVVAKFATTQNENSHQKLRFQIGTSHAEHDRFLILDDAVIYHMGASLKDLGKKWFAFSKMDAESFDILGRLG